MKTRKQLKISALLMNLMLSMLMGSLIGSYIEVNSLLVGIALFLLGTGTQLLVKVNLLPSGSLMEGINQEIWTDVLVQDFQATEDAAFLGEIPDYSRYVQSSNRNQKDIIHLVDVGLDPEVITNNITYPIGYQEQEDGDIPIQLDTHVTKATPITIEETQYITYDKIRLVQEKHKHAVMSRKHQKAAHALTPVEHTAKTPIIVTTGPDDGTGRKRLVPMDLLTHKKAYDDAKIPLSERVLVLSSEHYNDLLFYFISKDKDTKHLAYDNSGMLANRLEGFKTFLYIDVPTINVNTLRKASFGAEAVAGDQPASFSFHSKDMFRAAGRTWNITDPINTQTHASAYNVRHNYIVLPRKTRGTGAIVSATV